MGSPAVAAFCPSIREGTRQAFIHLLDLAAITEVSNLTLNNLKAVDLHDIDAWHTCSDHVGVSYCLFGLVYNILMHRGRPYAKNNGQWIARSVLLGFFGAPIEALPEVSMTDVVSSIQQVAKPV